MNAVFPHAQLFLASSSPRRREILESLGLSFRLVHPEVDERVHSKETPDGYVTRLARLKSRAGLAEADSDEAVVIGADTAVVHNGRIMGKPDSFAAAAEMLRGLSGAWHEVYTAVCICSHEHCAGELICSRVKFRALSEVEIAAYWRTGEPEDKAGAYAVQGLGAMFVERIEGSYSGIVGLPMFETTRLLDQWGLGPLHILEGVMT